MKSVRKVILYIAASLDGYIAKPGDNLDFLSIVEKKDEDYGYSKFMKSIDTVILGRKTFDWVVREMGSPPHQDKTTYVMTRSPKPGFEKQFFYNGNPKDLVLKLKEEPGKNIFIDGGGELVHFLMLEDLIDEFIISIIPVFLGDGIRLFREGRPEMNLKLMSSKQYDTGLLQMHYIRI